MLIDTLQPKIHGIILDMDGVLWRGSQPVVDLPALFAGFQHASLNVIMATNNASRSVSQYVERLAGFGVSIPPTQVVNSALAVVHMLKQQFPSGGPVYVIGEQGLKDHLLEGGFPYAEEKVVAVVAGLDLNFSYAKLRLANDLIRTGALFVATNPDPTYPHPNGLAPGAGSIIAAISTASQTQPIIAGKPYPAMMEMALARLGCAPAEALAVGDRLDTDILGAQRLGIRTALVMSGVTTAAELAAWTPAPDLVTPTVADLIDLK